MYNDYPTVYETMTNNNIVYVVILGLVALLIVIFTVLSLGKIYKKANRSAISAWIPIYNILVLLEIVNLPKWYIFLLLIPIVNIFIIIKIYFTLAKLFRKSKLFALGMLFVPVIFYPILAFGNSEYIGINLMAIGGKTQAVDIPVIANEEDKNPIVHEEEDVKSENIGISIGGGVYQKDYTNNLLEVDKNQEILKKPNLINSENVKKQPLDSLTSSFITQIPEEPIKEEHEPTIGISFPDPLGQIPNTNDIKLSTPEIIKPINSVSTEQVNTISNNNINEIDIFAKTNNVPKQENKNSETSEFITCPKCGAKLKNNVSTCFLCGTKLN